MGRTCLSICGWVAAPLLMAASGPETPVGLHLENLSHGGAHRPGELLVDLVPDAAPEPVAASAGCRVHRRIPGRKLFILECGAGPLLPRIRRLSARPDVRWVEASWYDDGPEATPNDLAHLQWYHENRGQILEGWTGALGADMSSRKAWDIVTGSRTRTVAILDVGLYLDHVDLQANRWRNPNEVCDNGVDDDDNGYIDDCEGWDIGGNDNDPSPLTLPPMRSDGSNCLRWHGTFIAGLAGAKGNNGIPLAGTAWDVSLMNLKRHRDSSCRSTTTRTTEAVVYATEHGADAIGLSFTGTTRSSSLEAALLEAEMRGVIAVMSAGNGGIDTTGVRRYPNDYPLQNKIIVTASDHRDALWAGSNYGAGKVDLAAPGDLVLTTGVDAPDAYGFGVGTSMSVGFVLGAVALVKEAFPELGPGEVRRAILDGVEAKPDWDCATSARCVRAGGRLDLFGALGAAAALAPARLETDLALEGEATPGATLLVRATITNEGRGPAHRLQARLQAEAPLTTTASTAPERVDPGETTRFELPVRIDADCRAERTRVTVRLQSAFAAPTSIDLDVPLRCSKPDAGTPSPDAGEGFDAGGTDLGGELPMSAGCRAQSKPPALAALLLLSAASTWRRSRRRGRPDRRR